MAKYTPMSKEAFQSAVAGIRAARDAEKLCMEIAAGRKASDAFLEEVEEQRRQKVAILRNQRDQVTLTRTESLTPAWEI